MNHAAKPFTSYKYLTGFSEVLIGAQSHREALTEAQRSINTEPDISNLYVWEHWAFLPVVPLIREEIERLRGALRMLDNKPFSVNIRPDQDRINSRIRELRNDIEGL